MITQLSHRSIIHLTGEDKVSFLQGLVTNDVSKIQENEAVYACLLTPQGKFLFDFFIVEQNGDFLIDCAKERTDEILAKLSMYKLRSNVELKNVSDDYFIYAGWNEDKPQEAFNDPRLADMGWRLISKTSIDTTCTEEDYHYHRTALGVPDGIQDLIFEKSILLENNIDQLNGIAWSKGCYMGQELNARTKYRGLVRKKLFPVRITGELPEFNADIMNGDKTVGAMCSSCRDVGLAMVRLEDYEEGASFTCGSSTIAPYVPDWMEIDDPS